MCGTGAVKDNTSADVKIIADGVTTVLPESDDWHKAAEWKREDVLL